MSVCSYDVVGRLVETGEFPELVAAAALLCRAHVWLAPVSVALFGAAVFVAYRDLIASPVSDQM